MQFFVSLALPLIRSFAETFLGLGSGRDFFQKVPPRKTLFCTEQTVAGVAETGHDIRVIVEIVVKCSGVDLHIGMIRLVRMNLYISDFGMPVVDFVMNLSRR